MACVHLASNLLDDFFDASYNDSAYRDRIASTGMRARIAKCDYLKNGKATFKDLKIAIAIFFSIACLIGIFFIYIRGINLIYLILFAAFLAFAYSGKPLQLSAHGFGELLIGLIFGPCLMVGMAIAASGYKNLDTILFFSVMMGLFTTNIVYTHSVIDQEADKAINKKTLAVLLCKPNRNLFFSIIFTYTPFIMIIAGVVSLFISPFYLLALLALPLAVDLTCNMITFQKEPLKKIKKRWYHKPMEQWDGIVEGGIDWFMIRWFGARNILIYFALGCMIAAFVS